MNQDAQIRDTEFLDREIPLNGASHADVVSYAVDVPLRYAQCFATLRDGRTARLCDPRQFVGWSRSENDRCLLFESGSGRILVPASSEIQQRVDRRRDDTVRRFITRDGGMLFVRNLQLEIASLFALTEWNGSTS